LPATDATTALTTLQQVLLIISTLLIVASGNVINDLEDVVIDRLNKPAELIVGKRVTYNTAYLLYFGLTTVAILCAFWLANSLGKPLLASIFIMISFLLYFYSTTLKKILLVGNLVISMLVGSVIVITGIFELYPALTDTNQSIQLNPLVHLVKFGALAFFINLLREWIKDCQDINGDRAGGRSTLPIILGRKRAARFIAVYASIFVVATGYWTAVSLYNDSWGMYYILFAIMAPVMIVAIKSWSVENAKELRILSLICKLVLLLGTLGIFIMKTT
jgi:4-hydroxybenzoate polyprenyltransferase